jgi:hypothetical protein
MPFNSLGVQARTVDLPAGRTAQKLQAAGKGICERLHSFILSGRFSRGLQMAMADDRLVWELPLPDVFGDGDGDRLLEALRRIHGEASRPDIAPEQQRALAAREERASRRREVLTAETA